MCALIFLVTLLAYLPALHGGFIWDDDGHVTRTDLRSLAGLFRIWFEIGATQQYYPLLHSAFWLEHRLWGDSAFGYHLLNVLLHASAASLAGMLLRRLAMPGAWFAALLFALHPVGVESVAWISEQKNTLSAVLYLGEATGERTNVELVKGRMVELFETATSRVHRGRAPVREIVVRVEAMHMQNVECRATSGAAELSIGVAVDQTGGNRQAAMSAECFDCGCEAGRSQRRATDGHAPRASAPPSAA